MDRYISIILGRRWVVVALALLVMLLTAGGARYLTVTSDYRTLFGEANPHLAAFDALENTYSASNVALIAIAPHDGNVFTRATLGAIEELTEESWRVPYSSRVKLPDEPFPQRSPRRRSGRGTAGGRRPLLER